MNLILRSKIVLRFILDLFFPKKCVGCKKSDTYFCESCIGDILQKDLNKNNVSKLIENEQTLQSLIKRIIKD